MTHWLQMSFEKEALAVTLTEQANAASLQTSQPKAYSSDMTQDQSHHLGKILVEA